MKTCRICGETKERSEFRKNKDRKDGIESFCKTCHRVKDKKTKRRKGYSKEYYTRNRERIALTAKRRYHENREQFVSYQRQSYRKHRDKRLLSQRKYTARRRARLNDAGYFQVTEVETRRLLSRPCYLCGDKATELDHVFPIARGGRHSIGNLAPICLPCNRTKKAKFLVEHKYGS